MKKRILLSMLLLFAGLLSGQAQDDIRTVIEQDIFRICQKPDTETKLRDYLKSLPQDADTVYALFFQPGLAPRSETVIPDFFDGMKQIAPEATALLIVDYPRPESAKRYMQKYGIKADYIIYDDKQAYQEIFSMNSGMPLAFAMKLSCRSGKALAIKDYQGFDTEFYTNLLEFNGCLPFGDYGTEKNDLPYLAENLPQKALTEYTDMKVNTPESFLISRVQNIPFLGHGHLLFNDDLNEGIAVFRQNQKGNFDFIQLVTADSIERECASQIPSDAFRRAEKYGFFFFLPLQPLMQDDSTIVMSYSVPNVWYIDNNPSRIGQANEASVFTRHLPHFNRGDIFRTNIDIHDHDYTYNHFNISANDDIIAMACNKYTWPIEMEREEYDTPAMNSFKEEFYDFKNPYMSFFDRKTGNVIARFGNLDECHRKSLTGYCFNAPSHCFHNKDIAYCDGFSGKIHIAPIDNPDCDKETYSVFNIDTSLFPEPDTTRFYTQEYSAPYKKFFYRIIRELKLTDSNVGCLISHGSHNNTFGNSGEYSVAIINRSTGKKSKFLLPKHPSFYIMAYGLTIEDDAIIPYAILADESQILVRKYHIPEEE